MELNPGFTGATLDRADALRANDEKLAAARADPRARLLGLNGLEPLTGGDGRLLWRPMHEAAAGNELVLLGLDGGEPRPMNCGGLAPSPPALPIIAAAPVKSPSCNTPRGPPAAPRA